MRHATGRRPVQVSPARPGPEVGLRACDALALMWSGHGADRCALRRRLSLPDRHPWPHMALVTRYALGGGRLPRPEDLSHALDICSRGTTVSTPIVSSGAVYR